MTLINPSDTIVAPATAPGRGGIGVVRLSGPGVPEIAAALLPRGLPEPRRATLATFRDGAGEALEQRLAGVGMGRREVEREAGVERLAGAVAEGRERGAAGFGQAPRQQPGGDRRHPRTRQTHHADAAAAGRGGGGDDGIGGVY